MWPAAASTNRKQMLQEASVSVLGAALKDSLSSQYGSCTTLPCCETPSVGGFTSGAALLLASRSYISNSICQGLFFLF